MEFNTNAARDKAEDVLHNLQKKAHEWLDAEEGLLHTLRELLDNLDTKGLSTADVRRRLEEIVGRIKANKLWDRVMQSEKVVALHDYRGELEKRAEEIAETLLERLPLATKADVANLEKQAKQLRRKLAELEGRPAAKKNQSNKRPARSEE